MNTTRIDRNAIPQDTVRYINIKTVTTSRNVGLSYEDEEDLRQCLYLAVVKAREAYDASHKTSLETFLHAATDLATKEFLRNRRREKRVRLICVLDEPVAQDGFGGDDETDCEETLIDTIADNRDGGIAEIDLHNEVRDALRGLDADSMRLCQLLMDGETVNSASKILGIERWVVLRKMIPGIAKRLEKIRSTEK